MKRTPLVQTFVVSFSSHCLIYAFLFSNPRLEASPIPSYFLHPTHRERLYAIKAGNYFELEPNPLTLPEKTPLRLESPSVKSAATPLDLIQKNIEAVSMPSPLSFLKSMPVRSAPSKEIASSGLLKTTYLPKKEAGVVAPTLLSKKSPGKQQPAVSSIGTADKETKALGGTKAYLSYFREVREKIREVASRQYKQVGAENGEVCVYFTLERTGVVRTSKVIPERSKGTFRLFSLALQSVHQAQPYPSFPDTLGSPELAFSVTILFQEDS